MGCVSIIMPARNAAATIQPSVASVLADSLVKELIVIDDQSTDSTRDLIEGFADPRVLLVSGPGSGIAAALNLGIQKASGEYVGRCDADDLFPPHRLAWQMEWLQKHADYIAVSGGFRTVTDSLELVADLATDTLPREVTKDLLQGEAVTHLGTWLIRSVALKAIGGARTWFETAEDLDLQFRLANYGRVWHEPKVAYLYRLHESSMTHTQDQARREFFEAMARKFALQRLVDGEDALELGNSVTVPPEFGEPLGASDHIVRLLVGSAWKDFETGRYGLAINTMGRALSRQPLTIKLWKDLLVLLGKTAVRLLRR